MITINGTLKTMDEQPKDPTKRLSRDDEERILTNVFELEYISNIGKYVGFRNNKEFNKYLKLHPEFKREFDNALIESCIFLEDSLRKIPKQYQDNPKVGEQLSRNVIQILKVRDPKKYGDKMQMDINQTVNITAALEAAENRLRDVKEVVETKVIELKPKQT